MELNTEYEGKVRLFLDTLGRASTSSITGVTPSVYYARGRKYDKITIRSSVRYFVERSTGTIYGSKDRKAPNLNWWFGTLDTINDWDWTGYHAKPLRDGIAILQKEYGDYRHWRPVTDAPNFPVAELDK